MGLLSVFYIILPGYAVRSIDKHAAEDNILTLAFFMSKGLEQYWGSYKRLRTDVFIDKPLDRHLSPSLKVIVWSYATAVTGALGTNSCFIYLLSIATSNCCYHYTTLDSEIDIIAYISWEVLKTLKHESLLLNYFVGTGNREEKKKQKKKPPGKTTTDPTTTKPQKSDSYSSHSTKIWVHHDTGHVWVGVFLNLKCLSILNGFF